MYNTLQNANDYLPENKGEYDYKQEPRLWWAIRNKLHKNLELYIRHLLKKENYGLIIDNWLDTLQSFYCGPFRHNVTF